MKTILAMLLAAALFSTGAAAQSPAPAAPPQEPAKTTTRPLNLKLDDADARRAVTFSPREGDEQRAADGLPALGGSASRAFDRPPPAVPSSTPGSPFPKDTEMR
jgi:hypothetical protein